MSGKSWRCALGLHSYVREHPADERSRGPNRQVCTRCGRRRDLDYAGVPPGIFGGGGAAG